MDIGWRMALAGMVALAMTVPGAMAVRQDGMVRFPEEHDSHSYGEALAVPADAAGFYSRAELGRYRVRVEPAPAHYRINPDGVYSVSRRHGYSDVGDVGRVGSIGRVGDSDSDPADGTLDSLQYCACVATPTCIPRTDLPNACGSGKVLCCYTKRPNAERQTNSEVFNEIDDEQTGGIQQVRSPALAGPSVLTGPGGPTGQLGPAPAVLTGPGGPTGQLGPYGGRDRLLEQDREALGASTAQRGVLVGPGGPTGRIGPQPAVLVGPGGPTGVIGPRGYGNNPYGNGRFGERPSILVGPGGPTGIVGPGRRPVLVGPSGVVGPWYRQRGAHAQPLLTGPNGRFRADDERQRFYG